MSITFIALAFLMTCLSFWKRQILISFSAALLWLAMAMWLFFGTAPLFDLSELYVQLLSWVFLMMTFVPFLAQLNTEIKSEKDGHSWSSFGQPPKRDEPNAYKDYRAKLFNRTRR